MSSALLQHSSAMNNSSTTMEKLCDVSVHMAENVPLAAFAIVNTIVCLLLMFFGLSFILLLLLYGGAIFHRNTRILLLNMSISQIVMCFGAFGHNVQFFIMTKFGDPTCPFVIPVTRCWWFRVPRVGSHFRPAVLGFHCHWKGCGDMEIQEIRGQY